MRFLSVKSVGAWRNGGARALGARGCGFESHRPDHPSQVTNHVTCVAHIDADPDRTAVTATQGFVFWVPPRKRTSTSPVWSSIRIPV
jgi:hypothetical protein